MSSSFPSRLARRALILWLGLKGSLEFRLGLRMEDLDQAWVTFDRLARLDKDSYEAQLGLGRIAERRLQSGAALEHFVRAFEIDAGRFAGAPIPKEIKRRILARQGLIRTAHRVTPESFPASLDSGEGQVTSSPGLQSGHGDFSGPAELRRFRGRPPISREEIDGTDLDDLLRRLSQGD